MPKETHWHQFVKEALKEIGESKGYDVSESEQEIILSERFKMYGGEERKIHTFSYRPDVVWKKEHIYRAIFEIEYLSPRSSSQFMEKRKYSIGSLILVYMAMIKKSAKYIVFITNNDNLCQEIGKTLRLADLKYPDNIWYFWDSSTSHTAIKKSLKKELMRI